ncbi:MAG: MIP/aquaporin family protein [Bacteroidota bacterium]
MNALIAEILGTMLLLALGGGVVANVVLKGTKGNNSGWIVITTGWALGVFVGVVVSGPYSGAHLNPAVTLALALAGKFSWAQVPGYMAAQVFGAMLGSFVVWLTYRDHFNQTEDKAAILGVFSTAPAIRKPLSNLWSEIIGTFVLIFTILYFTDASLSNSHELIGLGSIGALPVAFLVWAIGLSLGGTTGYAINPARDLGPRIMHTILPIPTKGNSDWAYSWVPIIGPFTGAALAAALSLLLNSAK